MPDRPSHKCSKCHRRGTLLYRFISGNSPRLAPWKPTTRTLYCRPCGDARVTQARADLRAASQH